MVFDSHPRPDHPHGAGFTFSTSVDATARYLHDLLAIDENILSDRTLQWQTQLLANFSGLLFVAKTIGRFDLDAIEAERAMVESSLTILALQAEVAELKSQNAALQREIQTAELKAEEGRSNSNRSSGSPNPPKKTSQSVWVPTLTKKQRKKKSSNGSPRPMDHRPSVF